MLSLLYLGHRHNAGWYTLALISRNLQPTGEKLYHHTSDFSTAIPVHATEECTLSYEIVNRVLKTTVMVRATEECILSYEIVNRVPKEDWKLRITCLRKCRLQGDSGATPSLLCSSIIAESWPHNLLFAHLFYLPPTL